MLSNLLKPTLRGWKGAETWNRREKVGKCRNPIKGATNNAYFHCILVLKYV